MSNLQRMWAFLKFLCTAFFYLLFKVSKFDIVYASSTPPSIGILAYCLTVFNKVPFVLETVDVWPDVPIGMGIIRNKFIINILNLGMNLIYRRAKRIIALSPDMKSQICTHGIPAEKVFVSFNGTNTTLFKPDFAQNYTQNKSKIIFLYAGTIGKANQLTQIIPLAKEFIKHNFSVEFRVIGAGNKQADFVDSLNQEKIPTIVFKKSVPKELIISEMQDATFGIVCFAPYEVLAANSANKFYDYLACGLPVLINYGGWQASWLKKYDCGISGDFLNPKDMVVQLIEIISDSEKLLRMRQNARQLAVEKFDRADIANSLAAIFEQIISQKANYH